MEPLPQAIDDIRSGIRAGHYTNEAAVSQGIVRRVLEALGWPAFDTQVVWPEYSAGSGKVDFALCHPAKRPPCFLEVKPIGKGDGNEEQLFEYAVHDGAPLAILTDGQGWSVFLPSGQGDYADRQVYKIDLVEHEAGQAAARLTRYLGYDAATSGQARQNALKDYENVERRREAAAAALPEAWGWLLTSGDEEIVALLERGVENICSYRPDAEMVAKFLAGQAGSGTPPPLAARPPRRATPSSPAQATPGQEGYTIHGKFTPTKNGISALIGVFEGLQALDPTLHERFAALPKHGRTRRYLALDRGALYQNKSLEDKSKRLSTGYWLPTNLSTQAMETVARLACQVKDLTYGRDVVLHLKSGTP